MEVVSCLETDPEHDGPFLFYALLLMLLSSHFVLKGEDKNKPGSSAWDLLWACFPFTC